MANVPDHNSQGIKESEIKVFQQKYYYVDDDGESPQGKDYPLRNERIEILADDDGVFIESKDGPATEVLSIATPEMAVRVAKYILEVYSADDDKEEKDVPDGQYAEIKFLMPEVQKRVAHELWRLENHCRSPHGPVDANGAYELLNHIKAISNYLDIKPAPHRGA